MAMAIRLPDHQLKNIKLFLVDIMDGMIGIFLQIYQILKI